MLRAATLTALLLAAPMSAAAQGQDETLADIRQQLSVMYVEVQRLNSELNTTGSPSVAITGNSALERLNAIEAELQRLTSKTEELEFRINRVTRDGTNRIGDLEYRLCELESGCDVSLLGDTPTLGGVDAAEDLPAPAPANETNGPALAVGEQADFERAQEALANGDFRSAADLFAAHTQTYPGGPLSAQAHYLRGEAYDSLGETAEAARAYLDSFSGNPAGDFAPDALFKLGNALGGLGQTEDACLTLAEVTNRFPSSDAALDAQDARAALGCS
ncbi:tol-pal system protein YbgF [Pelagovum pacificum]|uniref:Cell division coordinator CpoB n=1 Tax=Pelagovum pacificum TaxID=2588711 RepID=A0A5C5G891_9RHOB|nr:tol-pal system protein YbgF [Pelagovum pacificum]QQA41660.1 tol-pal system protein YbgF [Pelagovum pacificum]TNY30939.1 tol-pal system protein YbgF [Pelagovum pacificum]